MKNMTVRDCLLILKISILIAFFLTLSMDIAIGKPRIEINQGKISVMIENSTLEEVLNEVQKKAALKVKFYDVAAKSKRISASFDKLDLEEGLRRILRDNYVFYFIKDPQQGIQLSEIKIGSKSFQTDGLVHENIFSYGTGLKDIGVLNEGEGAQAGPASFYTANDGSLYIADTVNNKIKIYSATGEFLSTISHKGLGPNDISVDKNGSIYVYDLNGTLYQYDKTGNPTGQIAMDESRWDTLGPMHVVDNQVFARANGAGDTLLATIKDGKIQSPQNTSQSSSEILETGVLGVTSKNRYTAVLNEEVRGAEVKITNQSGSSTAFIPLEDIVSAEVLGEDRSANFYVKTEANKNNEIQVEVSKFDSSGTYTGTLSIPGNDYAFWSIRTLTVNEEGVINQMMPGQKSVTHRSYQFN
ncbi:MAG: 6-bladed beta-propeller [Desulfobacteraceae bacterium]|jgi:hypothetical protein